MLKSALTFFVALEAIGLIPNIPCVLANPRSAEVNQRNPQPDIFMGIPIKQHQPYFNNHKVELIKSIGGNPVNDIGLAYGKYENSVAFIKCFSRQPIRGRLADRLVVINREKTAFSLLQKAEQQPESKTQIGYDNVSRAYVSFDYLHNSCFVYSYDGDTVLSNYLISRMSSDDIPMIKTIITDILKGIVYLQYAHIAHNDIKLENIAISFPYPDKTRPKVTIIDFDLARQIEYINGKVVLVHYYLGSIQYIPPEVYAGLSADPNKRDVWAAGIALYAMLKKDYLFNNQNEKLLIRSIMGTITSGIPEQDFVFTDTQNKYPEMSLVVNALKAMLTPKVALRPPAIECLRILEGSGSSSEAQIASPQRTSFKTEIFNGGMGPVRPVPQNQDQWNTQQQPRRRFVNMPTTSKDPFGFPPHNQLTR